MSNVLAQFRTDLYRMIRSTFPEVVSPIATVPQIQRLNWVNQLKSGGLTAPWVAVHVPALTPEADFASVSSLTWRVKPTIYYIESINAGQGSIGDYLEERMSLLADALLFNPSYTILDAPETDCSEENPINESLLMNDMPFLCGSLSFEALVGYVPSAISALSAMGVYFPTSYFTASYFAGLS